MLTRALISSAFVLAIGGLLPTCRTWEEGDRRSSRTPEEAPNEPGTGGRAGEGAPAVVPSVNEAGAGGAPDPLASDVFGPGSTPSEPGVVACDDSVAGCDFARVDGCCSAKACEHASGADVFNTYPVESCQALVACVQSHPGCSTKDDPLCFQNEAPGAPCLQEAYLASHTDPDGPFAWTAELMACVCGY